MVDLLCCAQAFQRGGGVRVTVHSITSNHTNFQTPSDDVQRICATSLRCATKCRLVFDCFLPDLIIYQIYIYSNLYFNYRDQEMLHYINSKNCITFGYSLTH